MLKKKDNKKEEKIEKKKVKKLQKEVQALKDKIASLEEEKTEYLLGWQRARADYKNLQDNLSKERQASLRLGEENILLEFLPVIENFVKATASQGDIINDIKEKIQDKELLKKIDNWVLGVSYINKQFKTLFDNLGLEVIESLNKEFDPNYHEAVDSVSDEKIKDNMIVKEMQTGYIFKDKIIRPSKVVVNRLEENDE